MKNEFKTLDEQIEILKVKKKVIFPSAKDEDLFRDYLKRNNYINIINPYKVYFFSSKDESGHIYTDSTPYKKYLYHYESDLKISHLILGEVFRFEKFLSSVVSYVLSEKLENDKEYFEKLKKKSIYSLVDKRILKREDVEKYYSEKFQLSINALKVKHTKTEVNLFRKAYDIRAFEKKVKKHYSIDDIVTNEWFLNINFLSFEDLLFLFKIMGKNEQQKVIRVMGAENMPIVDFNVVCRNIKKLRNKLAHLENLTIVINKQLNTDSKKVIIRGEKVFNTMKNVYMFNNKIIPGYIKKLRSDFYIRYNKYEEIGLI